MATIEKMYRNVEIIARRTQELNPHAHSTWADNIVELLDAHEIGVAIDRVFQDVFGDDESIIDIRLHDLLYLIAIGNQLQDAHPTRIKDLLFVQNHAVKKYESED